MKSFFVSVSFLLFASCIGLLAIEIQGAEVKLTKEKFDDRRQNLRHGSRVVEDAEENGRSLIVGGNDAKDYPQSIVFLSDRTDKLQCGGTLISPTVVLAAGHCEISLVTDAVFRRFDSNPEPNSKEAKNEIRIKTKQEIFHPEYQRITLQHDVMLIQLEKSPNEVDGIEISPPIVPYMKLHTPEDPTLQDLLKGIEKRKNGKFRGRIGSVFRSYFNPESRQSLYAPQTTALQLKALGWGHTATGPWGEPSDVLQEVVLNWVKNDECEKAQESTFKSYQHRITDDMFCTWRAGMDTCNGDSGGPIVIENPNYKKNKDNTGFQFVQVGIISWGEDCADHVFPGVASRVSEAYDWIRDRVCSIDGPNAPEYFECVDEHTYSPSPTTSPTNAEDAIEMKLRKEAMALINGVEDPTIKVAIEIFLDVYAFETSWKLIEVETGQILINVPYNKYEFDNKDRVEFDLKPGKQYKFIIYDQFGDGIGNDGSYRIYTVDESKYETVGEILSEGHGEEFRYKKEHLFTVPQPIPPPIETPISRIDSGEEATREPQNNRESQRLGQIIRFDVP